MERCWLVLWISVTCLFGGALPQYRDKNISRETDAVQGILARYLQKRLQGVQIFNPPPPSVLFSLNRQSRARKTVDKSDDEVDVDLNRTGSEERREDYDDYEDDLQGFEDSECSRTRINLFGESTLTRSSKSPLAPLLRRDGFLTTVRNATTPFNSSTYYDCPNCVDEHSGSIAASRWTMPLLKLGEKRYYLGIFFKANWYRASQYCRYHGMHLASIASQEENDRLEKHIKDFGLGHEHFWTSGTDQAEEGTFFWMANGRPVTFENWNVGEPNNFRYENGEEEHCLELWNRDGKGLKWNDSPCSFETFFVCEVQ